MKLDGVFTHVLIFIDLFLIVFQLYYSVSYHSQLFLAAMLLDVTLNRCLLLKSKHLANMRKMTFRDLP